MNTGTKGRRAWSGLLWLALAAAGCWSGGAVAQNSSGAIPDGRGRVVALAAGSFHNCALRSDGSVACWGSNWTGESTAPSRGHFTAVAAGYFHSCGLHSDGSVECWGGSSSVRAVPAGERFTAIASGTYHVCGLRANGSVVCWGDNSDGQATPPINSAMDSL